MAARSGSILPMRRGRPGHRPVERTLVAANSFARPEQPGLEHGFESPDGIAYVGPGWGTAATRCLKAQAYTTRATSKVIRLPQKLEITTRGRLSARRQAPSSIYPACQGFLPASRSGGR